MEPPLEIVFQEQSYSSLHLRRSLAWDHFCGDIDDPCGIIANFCGGIAQVWKNYPYVSQGCIRMYHKEWFRMYHNVLQVFHDVLLCLTMFGTRAKFLEFKT